MVFATLMSFNPACKESVFFYETGKQNIQRVVASPAFYRSSRKRFDTVMVKNSEHTFQSFSDSTF